MRFHLKRPTGKRRSYSIVKHVPQGGGKEKTFTVYDQAIETINEQFHAGSIDSITAVKNLNEIIARLYKDHKQLQPRAVHNQDNYNILKRYWKAEYENRDLVDPETAKADLLRAVNAIGDLPLLSATKEQLQNAVDSKFRGNKQRRIIQKLTQILIYLGRADVKLRLAKPAISEVKYLTEAEFELVLNKIEDPLLKLLSRVCFHTGARMGEAFDLNGTVNDRVLYIATQIDKFGVRRATKNRKPRTTVIVEKAVPLILEWAQVKDQFTMKRTAISKAFRKACRAAFPNNRSKLLKFHDLRHCYAIGLLNKGATVKEVADSIGDSAPVCERHYLGFIHTTSALERLKKLTG
jgi:integrase